MLIQSLTFSGKSIVFLFHIIKFLSFLSGIYKTDLCGELDRTIFPLRPCNDTVFISASQASPTLCDNVAIFPAPKTAMYLVI